MTTIQQYDKAKAELPNVLIAIKIGDCYEFLGNDAEVVSNVLGTNRIPCKSPEYDLAKLLRQGLKVALCDCRR